MTPRLRILMFGTGGLISSQALRALATDHEVVAVVRAVRRGPLAHQVAQLARRAGLLTADPLSDAARALRVRQWPVTGVADARFAQDVARRRPDLICVAHFPWRVPDTVLSAASLGGINLHPSLLPRHRGPLPLFWIYHSDDRVTGVTVHHMTQELDGGDIIAQRSFPLERGCPADALNAANARSGGEVLRAVVASLGRGSAPRHQQDNALATRAPSVERGRAMVDFTWDVERTWHFLAGVWPRFVEPLVDVEGRKVGYAGVLGYERGVAGGPPGTARRLDAGRLALQCESGIVVLRSQV